MSFNALQHARPHAHLQFYAFDILIHSGRKGRPCPLEDRRALLTDALHRVEYPVIQSTAFDVTTAQLIKAAKELDREGVIAKRKGAVYEPGRRSGAWF